jgi:hypothetical protein
VGFKQWWAGIKLETRERFGGSPHTSSYLPMFRETSPNRRLDAVLTKEPYYGKNMNPQTSHASSLFLVKPGKVAGYTEDAEFKRWEDTAIKIVWKSDTEFEVRGDYDVCEVKGRRLQLLSRDGYTTIFGCS